jgi:hypothetical protein
MNIGAQDLQMSPLAGYGLCFIVMILGGLGLERFSAAENTLERGVIAAQTELATLAAIKDTDHWAERLIESTKARQQLQSEIWLGNTSGVIAAELQQALRGLAQQHKFENIQVRVDPDPLETEGVTVLNFEFSGRAPSAKVLADYFEGLAVSPKLILIDEAYFAQNVRSPRPPVLTFSGFIPVQIAPSGRPQ